MLLGCVAGKLSEVYTVYLSFSGELVPSNSALSTRVTFVCWSRLTRCRYSLAGFLSKHLLLKLTLGQKFRGGVVTFFVSDPVRPKIPLTQIHISNVKKQKDVTHTSSKIFFFVILVYYHIPIGQWRLVLELSLIHISEPTRPY